MIHDIIANLITEDPNEFNELDQDQPVENSADEFLVQVRGYGQVTATQARNGAVYHLDYLAQRIAHGSLPTESEWNGAVDLARAFFDAYRGTHGI